MFSITTELPIYYSVLCILLGVVYAYFLYRRNKFLSKKLTALLFVFRALVVSVLSFLLLNPLSSVTNTIEKRPIIILAQDASFSTFSDSSDYQNLINLKNKLSSDFDVITYNYSDQIKEGFTTDKTGNSTNISHLLDEVDLKYSGRNLTGVVLSWDGLYNQGSNPLSHKIAKSIPFYTIPLGDTSVLKDVRISEIQHNEISFLGNTAPVKVNIQTEKCKGEYITIKLFSEWKLIESKKIKINSNSEFIKTNFTIKNSSLGLHKYKVVVSSVSNEKSIENNSRSFYVEVLDSKYKILILYDAIHPDISAIKSVLDKNKNYEIVKEKLSEFNSNYDKYNLVIYFAFSDNKLEELEKLKSSDVSLLLLVGPNSVSKLNYLYPSGKIVGKNKSQEVTASYNSDFSKFNVSTNLQNYLTDLPPLLAPFGTYNQSLTSEIILYQKIGLYTTEKPLIIVDNNSEKKYSVVYSEGLWKWKINDRNDNNLHQNFDELFSKMAQFLLIKEDKSRFRINYDKKIIQGKDMNFFAEYYNENYELNNEKDVSLHIRNKDGVIDDYVFSKNTNSSYFLKLSSRSEGSYSFTAKYNNSEQIVKGEFTILPKQIESKTNTANHQILYQLSTESNAHMFDNFNADQIVDTLKNNPLNKTLLHTSEKVKSVINIKWILILILLFILIEMVVRRYNGTY
ncbi:MAG: hypothetical protein HN702_00010 [Flavobacteriales bacterium]|jgi:hypothetical protein|nr:hypothetical protein [Flavobacteriales bacterium]MBT7725750.1 hypothetical protein [Flavobacteriales bacterium]